MKSKFVKTHAKENKPHYYKMLLKWFESKESYEKVTEFVIKNYDKEHSVYLLRLISLNYIKFHTWLKKRKEKRENIVKCEWNHLLFTMFWFSILL